MLLPFRCIKPIIGKFGGLNLTLKNQFFYKKLQVYLVICDIIKQYGRCYEYIDLILNIPVYIKRAKLNKKALQQQKTESVETTKVRKEKS